MVVAVDNGSEKRISCHMITCQSIASVIVMVNMDILLTLHPTYGLDGFYAIELHFRALILDHIMH